MESRYYHEDAVSSESRAPNINTQQTSSYWSVPEQTDFPALFKCFGTDWHAIANFMTTKTHIMVKNYYQRQVDNGKMREWEDIARDADEKKARGEDTGPLPQPTILPKRRYDIPPGSLQRAGSAMEGMDDVRQVANAEMKDREDIPRDADEKNARGEDTGPLPQPTAVPTLSPEHMVQLEKQKREALDFFVKKQREFRAQQQARMNRNSSPTRSDVCGPSFGESTPIPISPKDVDREWHENEEDAKWPLFPPQQYDPTLPNPSAEAPSESSNIPAGVKKTWARMFAPAPSVPNTSPDPPNRRTTSELYNNASAGYDPGVGGSAFTRPTRKSAAIVIKRPDGEAINESFKTAQSGQNAYMSSFESPAAPKSVAFELTLPQFPGEHRSVRVQKRDFYGLSADVSFQDADGKTLIPEYENVRDKMVVYVRDLENPS
ncbi:hypothetical protein DL95DRAFT_468197 [Leptodontidium sp. 2 PMI_412]|nr:hypothetical protein DL95DRAFT_468197 [Leptodontidium sp. 2 PMI_412]